MADSDLQAALHQSRVFDLNQVRQRWPSRVSPAPTRPSQPETIDFHAISRRLQARNLGDFTPLSSAKHSVCFCSSAPDPPWHAMQAHANVFPHHSFGPEPIDDQVAFEPSRPISNGMFTLKGKHSPPPPPADGSQPAQRIAAAPTGSRMCSMWIADARWHAPLHLTPFGRLNRNLFVL